MNKDLIAIPIIIISIIVYPYFISPLWKDIQDLTQKKESLNETIKKVEEFVIVRDNLLNKKKQFSDEELSRVNILLPSGVDEIQTILNLQQLALSNGLVIENISASEGERERGRGGRSEESSDIELYTPVSVSLSFLGNYNQLKTFLKVLSESLTLFEISSLSFGRPDEETGVTNFSIDIVTSAYNE